MTPSQWAAYKAETSETKFIETEHGFISYSLLPDSIYLEDIWVHPDHRKNSIGAKLVSLAEEEGIKAGKTISLAVVNLHSKTCIDSLKAHLAIGFIPFMAQDNKVWLRRDIMAGG